MSYQSVPTAVTNEVIPSSWWNTYVRDNMLALHEAVAGVIPSARVYNSANISIPNNTVTVLTFNSELLDTDNIHDTATNPSRLTCKTAGLYAIYGNAQFAAHATGARSVLIRLNGTTFIAEAVAGSAGIIQSPPVSTQYPLEVGDYIELAVWQNSGGSLAVNYVDAYTPVFGMTYLGRV